jgi:predicted transposase/invertase (TIGR01784 family)
MWSVFLGHASDLKHRGLINEIIEKKEALGMAGEVLAAISKDEHERAKFMSRRKAETDRVSDLLTAEERGRIEGEERGRTAMRRQIAHDMKSESIATEIIARVTKLPIPEIEKL